MNGQILYVKPITNDRMGSQVQRTFMFNVTNLIKFISHSTTTITILAADFVFWFSEHGFIIEGKTNQTNEDFFFFYMHVRCWYYPFFELVCIEQQ